MLLREGASGFRRAESLFVCEEGATIEIGANPPIWDDCLLDAPGGMLCGYAPLKFDSLRKSTMGRCSFPNRWSNLSTCAATDKTFAISQITVIEYLRI